MYSVEELVSVLEYCVIACGIMCWNQKVNLKPAHEGGFEPAHEDGFKDS